MKNFEKIMIIVGLVIGSGFASGKEIAVFFSRFGKCSFILIPFVFLLFFLGIYYILNNGENRINKFYSSKSLLRITVFVNIIFTSSMMAGTIESVSNNEFSKVLGIILMLILCIRATKNGVQFLSKINKYLVPILIALIMFCVLKNLKINDTPLYEKPICATFYSILYVIMNFSSSCLVMGTLGEKSNKKGNLIVAFASAFILAVILFAINFVLVNNPIAINMEFPLLEMSSGIIRNLMRCSLFIGCLTSLLSIVFLTTECLKKLEIEKRINCLISIFFPFLISLLGFGNIVSYLYPLSSIFGGIVLFLIYIMPIKKE